MVRQLLWFVGIYLGACAFALVMRDLHRRWRLWVVAVLVALACIVDVVRFGGGPELVGNLNSALVWLAVVLRPLMARVLGRPRVWRAVVIAGPFAMTAFLWHRTALMAVLLAALLLRTTRPSQDRATTTA
jgi:hypothetical protein